MKRKGILALITALVTAVSSCGAQPQTQFVSANTQPYAIEQVQLTTDDTSAPIQQITEPQTPQMYDVSLMFTYRENMIANKYDAVISIDGEYAGMIAQGEEKTLSVSAAAGQHTVEVSDSNDKNNYNTATFTVSGNGDSYAFFVAAKWDRIEISQEDPGEYSSDIMFTSAINVNYIENIIVNKYNIEIYADNQYIGGIEQGKAKMFSVQLRSGTHTLRVQELGNSKNSDSVTFDVMSDGYCYVFECKAKWGGISIKRGNDYQIR